MIVPATKLPEFRTTACVGTEPGKEFKEIGSKDQPDKWLVLYTYPKDLPLSARRKAMPREVQRCNKLD